MKAFAEEHMDARSFLLAKLAEPDTKVEKRLNSIVNQWVASRRGRGTRRTHI
jgi:hypothetical protein